MVSFIPSKHIPLSFPAVKSYLSFAFLYSPFEVLCSGISKANYDQSSFQLFILNSLLNKIDLNVDFSFGCSFFSITFKVPVEKRPLLEYFVVSVHTKKSSMINEFQVYGSFYSHIEKCLWDPGCGSMVASLPCMCGIQGQIPGTFKK